MAAIIDEHEQFLDSAGKPLVGGFIYIGTQGLDPVTNPKSIFSDRALSSALANPQTLDALGQSTNKIWTDGQYSIKIEDLNNAQIYQNLDAGPAAGTAGTTPLSTVVGVDAITATGNPTLTAYTDKEIFIMVSAGANTGPVTLDIDSLGAKALLDARGIALEADDIVDGLPVVVAYESANDKFYLVNAIANTAELTASKTGTYTVATAERDETHILSDVSFTATLPTAATAGDGFKIGFKFAGTEGTNIYTIDGNGTETIDGALTYRLVQTNQTIALICDGTNWKILTDNVGGRVPLSIKEASAGPVDFDTNNDLIDFTAFKKFEIDCIDLISAGGSGRAFHILTSTDGGTSFDVGATDYAYTETARLDSGAYQDNSSAGDTEIEIATIAGWGANEYNVNIKVYNPSSASSNTYFSFTASGEDSTGGYTSIDGGGARLSVADVDGIRLTDSGTGFTTGTFKIYGIK